MPAPSQPSRCPCGSREPYAACCGPLHAGRAAGSPTASTAEQLMRSRFSAFALDDMAYLVETWHPSTRPAVVEPDADIEWRRLQVLHVQAGGEDDDDGTVEFVAHFVERATGAWDELQERSAFLRDGGQWFYVGPA